MKKYKSRDNVPLKYKWNLGAILQNRTAESYLNDIKQAGQHIVAQQGKYLATKSGFCKYLKTECQMLAAQNVYGNWISNNISTNVVDPTFQKLGAEYTTWLQRFCEQTATNTNYVLKNKAQVIKYLEDPKLTPYRFTYHTLFTEAKHVLSSGAERLLAAFSRGLSDVEGQFSVLTNSEMNFKPVVDTKGHKHNLTQGTYHELMQSSDALLRKNTYKEFWTSYLDHKQTLAKMLYEHKKQESTTASVRRYKSTVHMLTSSDHLDPVVLQTLYRTVQKHSQTVRRARTLWRRNYKQKFGVTPRYWDYAVQLVKPKNKYNVRDAKKIVLEALKPMGQEYVSVVKKAFADRWIDFLPCQNKRSGAYSIGNTYGLSAKYICMNFDCTFRSVETLAHELGHSLHSYYADKHNHIVEAEYEILVAEIASTYNELLLADHTLKTSTSLKARFYTLERLIQTFAATVYRQTVWSEYEWEFYKELDARRPLNTHESQLNLYKTVLKRYRKRRKIKTLSPSERVASFFVPHYYYGFYVYKYAVGIMTAYAFFEQYKSHGQKAVENYIRNFLSAGGKGKPVDRLKNAGVNPTDPAVFERAFRVFAGYIDEYQRLSKKLFPVGKIKRGVSQDER